MVNQMDWKNLSIQNYLCLFQPYSQKNQFEKLGLGSSPFGGLSASLK